MALSGFPLFYVVLVLIISESIYLFHKISELDLCRSLKVVEERDKLVLSQVLTEQFLSESRNGALCTVRITNYLIIVCNLAELLQFFA